MWREAGLSIRLALVLRCLCVELRPCEDVALLVNLKVSHCIDRGVKVRLAGLRTMAEAVDSRLIVSDSNAGGNKRRGGGREEWWGTYSRKREEENVGSCGVSLEGKRGGRASLGRRPQEPA